MKMSIRGEEKRLSNMDYEISQPEQVSGPRFLLYRISDIIYP